MKTKTWKIGEYCQGGIITVEKRKGVITIIGKEWDFSKGSHRGSDQSNAKPFIRQNFSETQIFEMRIFLNDLTRNTQESPRIHSWDELG